MHLEDGLQVLEEIIRDEPSIEELIPLHEVNEQLEVSHVVILLGWPVIVIDNDLSVQNFLGQESHQLCNEHFQLLRGQV